MEISDKTLPVNAAIHRGFRQDHSTRRPDVPSNRRLRSRPVKKSRLKVTDLPSFYKEAATRSGRINFVKRSENGKNESRHGWRFDRRRERECVGGRNRMDEKQGYWLLPVI